MPIATVGRGRGSAGQVTALFLPRGRQTCFLDGFLAALGPPDPDALFAIALRRVNAKEGIFCRKGKSSKEVGQVSLASAEKPRDAAS